MIHSRESHVSLNGDIVDSDKSFKNGLDYPGDPKGSASEVINCRCVLIPIVKSTKKSDNGLKSDDKSGIIKENRPIQIGGVNCDVKNEKFAFSTGSSKQSQPKNAVVYELPEGTRFVFPKNYNKSKQTMTPENAIKTWYKVPENIRNKAQKTIQFVDYYNPMDSYWKKQYKNFGHSYATGGDTITFYRYEKPHDLDYVVRTYCHEAGHYMDINNGVGNVKYSSGAKWTKAIKDYEVISGNSSVTTYGKNAPTEDFAESIAEYISNPKTFEQNYPNRAELIKQILK